VAQVLHSFGREDTVGEFTGNTGRAYQRTELSPAQQAIFRGLDVAEPPRFLALTPAPDSPSRPHRPVGTTPKRSRPHPRRSAAAFMPTKISYLRNSGPRVRRVHPHHRGQTSRRSCSPIRPRAASSAAAPADPHGVSATTHTANKTVETRGGLMRARTGAITG
jgi:hypothetical protein